MAAVPADAYALPKLPGYDSLANCVDNARDLVSRNSGILQAGPMPFFYEGIAVTVNQGTAFRCGTITA
jgi:hypothetical protein